MPALVVGLHLGAAVVVADAAELKPATAAAFEHYVRVTETRLDGNAPFLWVDGLPEPMRRTVLDGLRKGALHIEALSTRDRGREIDIPDGMVHHWMGVAFIEGATVEDALALLQDYDRHAELYSPNVARSRLVARNGDDFRVFLRFFMRRVITVVVNSDHQATFRRDGRDRASSRIYSTRIAEVKNPDTSEERELPVGNDGGYLWRLNTYWRLLARDGGVFVQCESVTLTRGIPAGFGWLIRPFVTGIPRDTLTFTLETTRRVLASAR